MSRRRDFDPVFVSEFNRLLTETIALGVKPDKALKYWSWTIEHEVRRAEREDRGRVHDA